MFAGARPHGHDFGWPTPGLRRRWNGCALRPAARFSPGSAHVRRPAGPAGPAGPGHRPGPARLRGLRTGRALQHRRPGRRRGPAAGSPAPRPGGGGRRVHGRLRGAGVRRPARPSAGRAGAGRHQGQPRHRRGPRRPRRGGGAGARAGRPGLPGQAARPPAVGVGPRGRARARYAAWASSGQRRWSRAWPPCATGPIAESS